MSAEEIPVQEDTIASVRGGLELLVGVIKKYAFYPESNATLQQAIGAFHIWLYAFVERQGPLRIDIEKNQVVYRGQMVHSEKSAERAVIFPLFRDGVQWLEFLEGVSLDEVRNFIRLVNQYREHRDESENDLVTAMWEADFPCIRHKAVDKFWEADTLVDISSFRNAPGPRFGDTKADKKQVLSSDGGVLKFQSGQGSGPAVGWGGGDAGGQSSSGGSGRAPDAEGFGFDAFDEEVEVTVEAEDVDQKYEFGREARTICDPAVRAFMERLELAQAVAADPGAGDSLAGGFSSGGEAGHVGQFWKLTPDEEELLKEMIVAEERRNTTKDCLDILLVMVGEPLDVGDRALLQDFVAEEMQAILAQGEFAYARTYVERLAVLKKAGRSSVSRLADDIMGKIAGVGVLGTLNQIWPRIRSFPETCLAELRRLFLLLPPSSVDSLGPMAARVGDPRIQGLLVEVITYQAGRSQADLSHVIGALPPALICQLVSGYAIRGQNPPVGLLTRLTRHNAAAVREAAAKALVADNPDNLKSVFHLLNDPDRNVSRAVLALLGRERNQVAERLLLDYLTEKTAEGGARDENLILNCYRALGHCASRTSIGFLRAILMKRSWRALFGLEQASHRTGAAIALSLMPPEWGVAEVLQDAERSTFIGIRRAHAQARQHTRRMERKANG